MGTRLDDWTTMSSNLVLEPLAMTCPCLRKVNLSRTLNKFLILWTPTVTVVYLCRITWPSRSPKRPRMLKVPRILKMLSEPSHKSHGNMSPVVNCMTISPRTWPIIAWAKCDLTPTRKREKLFRMLMTLWNLLGFCSKMSKETTHQQHLPYLTYLCTLNSVLSHKIMSY